MGCYSDLRMQVTELEQQISSKLELTNEMNCLLVQRAHRIEELENMLASFNCNDASSFCNGGIDQVGACTDVIIAITYVAIFCR